MSIMHGCLAPGKENVIQCGTHSAGMRISFMLKLDPTHAGVLVMPNSAA